jgi:RNA-directed DNA polymerase
MTRDGRQRTGHGQFSAPSREARHHKVQRVRCADDLVLTGSSQALRPDQVLPGVQRFLQERGRELSPEKTTITPGTNGFDVLGRTVRRFGRQVLRRPAQGQGKTVLNRLRDTIRRSGHWTAGQWIQHRNPILRGGALYHRSAPSARTFDSVDRVQYQCWWRWARRRHRQRKCAWIGRRYWPPQANGARVFSGVVRDEGGRTVAVQWFRASGRHKRWQVLIRGAANP